MRLTRELFSVLPIMLRYFDLQSAQRKNGCCATVRANGCRGNVESYFGGVNVANRNRHIDAVRKDVVTVGVFFEGVDPLLKHVIGFAIVNGFGVFGHIDSVEVAVQNAVS